MLNFRPSLLLIASLVLLVVGASCTKKNDIPAVDAGDPVDAAPAAPDADLSLFCQPASTTCEAAVLSTCIADGSAATPSDCDLGCFDAVRCNKLAPSNGLGEQLDMAASATDLVLTGAATIDTSSETINDETGALVVSTAVVSGGPVEIFVLRVKSLTAGSITVTGTRALAIVSDGAITLNGGLDASGVSSGPNTPGGIDDTATCGAREVTGSGNDWPGGGGGGFGGTGGNGGSALGHGGGAGSAINGTASLVPLRGGCAGGRSIGAVTGPGAGGGAVQLVSNRLITIPATGHVAVTGEGASGFAGFVFCAMGNGNCYAGAGGGAGGGVLLEAPSVVVAAGAGIFANGGGGSTTTTTENAPSRGEDGQLSETSAAGGVSQETDRGNGGAGGAGATANGGSGQGTSIGDDFDGGGGGGGVGRIRINLPVGASTAAIEGTVSPPASFGALGTR